MRSLSADLVNVFDILVSSFHIVISLVIFVSDSLQEPVIIRTPCGILNAIDEVIVGLRNADYLLFVMLQT